MMNAEKKNSNSALKDPIGHVVVSIIRALEKADRYEEEYDRVKHLPGCEATAARHLESACDLKRRASELLKVYEDLRKEMREPLSAESSGDRVSNL